MCCGSSRTANLPTRTISPASNIRPQPHPPAPRQRSYVAYFEYTGTTAMTVLGPGSGMTYRFPSPGSRLAIDLRDRAAIAKVPGLIEVHGL